MKYTIKDTMFCMKMYLVKQPIRICQKNIFFRKKTKQKKKLTLQQNKMLFKTA